MSSKICMNEACRVTTSSDWKSGWELKSGGFATLCVSCGIAYEKFTFCNIFHKTEDGWRKCKICGKDVHCGCPASKMQVEILDMGGVRCRNCVKHIDTNVNTACASASNPSQVDVAKVALAKDVGSHVQTGMKRKYFSEILQTRTGLLDFQKYESQASNQKNSDAVMAPFRKVHTLSFGKPAALITQSTASEARYHQYMPRPISGKGRAQMLHHYRPRTTEQELQQMSQKLKSAIVPLFEKPLSATDVGRMDRLVLPKYCTEEYLPPVNEPGGLPIKVLDVNAMQWMFLLRFWQNNGSRMYVMEGISSFIKKMGLQAGDIVTFNRMHPSGNLMMAFRKLARDPVCTSRVQAQCATMIPMISANHSTIEPPVMAFGKLARDPACTSRVQAQCPVMYPMISAKHSANHSTIEPPVMAFRKLASDPACTSRVQAQCAATIPMISAKHSTIEPPVMGNTAIFTMKASASSSLALNEVNPKGLNEATLPIVHQATLNEGYKGGIMGCTNNNDFEHSGLDILATTALLTENLVQSDQVGATQKQPQLPTS